MMFDKKMTLKAIIFVLQHFFFPPRINRRLSVFGISSLSAVITIQREPVSAVSSDINFPMKGRRGMKDWARTAEDKLFIPKEVFTSPTEGRRS